MSVQLTIIGLGQIGASFGLALEEYKGQILRMGHDPEPTIAVKAQQKKAIDRISYNLPASVENADMILIDLPMNQMHDTLKIISPCLKDKSVVMDTNPIKRGIVEWMKELLPLGRYYVGLVPAINPHYLELMDTSIDSARRDLFVKGSMGIAAPAGTDGTAIKLAIDLVTLLGANVVITDFGELDGIMSRLQIMPQLNTAVLSDVMMDSPGWKEGQKMAGPIFAQSTSLIGYEGEASSLLENIFMNRENVFILIDEMIAKLEEVKARITGEEKEAILEWLEKIRSERSLWWQERSKGNWRAGELEKIGVPPVSVGRRLFGNLGKLFGMQKASKDNPKSK